MRSIVSLYQTPMNNQSMKWKWKLSISTTTHDEPITSQGDLSWKERQLFVWSQDVILRNEHVDIWQFALKYPNDVNMMCVAQYAHA